MSICPFAVQRILPENESQSKITPRAVILHTAVDSSTPNSSIHGYFARGDVGVESHFYVLDNGTIEQYMDTYVRADANADANSFAVSIETEDDGNPAQNAWTDAQVEAIVRLVTWICDTHRIPKVKIPTSTGSGIGWHAMWGAPSAWTPAVGKTCPGAPRIAQIPNIIARVATPGGTLMALTDEQQTILYNKVVGLDVAIGETFKTAGKLAGTVLLNVDTKLTGLVAAVAALSSDTDLTHDEVAAIVDKAVEDHSPKAEDVARALAPLLPDLMSGIPDEQFAALIDAVNDEADRREAARANTEV